MSDNEVAKQIFETIHSNFGVTMELSHYLDSKLNSEEQEKRVYKTGWKFIDSTDWFQIEATSYEICVSIPEAENITKEPIQLIYKLGEIEILREEYSPSELLNLLKHEHVNELKKPDQAKVDQYLKIFSLFHSHISVGKEGDIDKLLLEIQQGEIIEGAFHQLTNDGYEYIVFENGGAKMKKLIAPSINHLIYGLAGGGNLASLSEEINEALFDEVFKKVRSLASDFNKEFIMSLMAIEDANVNYSDLIKRYNEV